MGGWTRLIAGRSRVRRQHSRARRLLALQVGVVALVAACSSEGLFYDPVFVSVGPAKASTGTCPSESTCVEVRLEALGEAAGEAGECALYRTPGDPATMEPLVAEAVRVPEARTDELEIPFVWEVAIPQVIAPRDLNPVCGPMVEG